MIEPTIPTIPTLASVSLFSVFTGWLGLELGPWGFLLFGAMVGGWLAMSEVKPCGAWASLKFMTGRMVLSAIFTFPVAWAVLQLWAKVPLEVLLIVSSFGIAWQWDLLSSRALAGLKARLTVAQPAAKGDAP
jgi:hypothetical protein